MVLLTGNRVVPRAPAPPAESSGLDKGEKVGTVRIGAGDVTVFKKVRTAVLSAITTKMPSGEWFKPHLIHSAIAQFYPRSPSKINKYSSVYLIFLEQLKFLEHNKKNDSGSKYRWFPRYKDQTLTEEEVRRRIEEDRKALQDVMG